MKTKRRNSRTPTVNLVGCEPLLYERIRASLRRSPFLFLATDEPLPVDETDLYVAAAADVGDLPSRGAPVIAWGAAGLMRSAFLRGCVDFLREPWLPEELELRARAAFSRMRARHEFPWGALSFEGDLLRLPGGAVALTHGEALILRALLRSRGDPVPREALSYAVDGTAAHATGRTIDVHVAALRRKVRGAVPEAGRFIVCVRDQGYMIG